MFKFLKNKIKDAVDKFKKSAEEEIEETQEAQEEIEQLEEQSPVDQPQEQPALDQKSKEPIAVDEPQEEAKEEAKEDLQEEVKEDVKVEVQEEAFVKEPDAPFVEDDDSVKDDDKDLIDITPQPAKQSADDSTAPKDKNVQSSVEAPAPLAPKPKEKVLKEVKSEVKELTPPPTQIPKSDSSIDMEKETPQPIELKEDSLEQEYETPKKGFLGRIFSKKKESIQEEEVDEEREELKEDAADKIDTQAEESVLDEVKQAIKKEDEAISLEQEQPSASQTADELTPVVEPIKGVLITYFVHGTTTDSEQHIATGWNPGELSPLGVQQSKELGTQVAHKHFAVVISSDLKRAVDSAVFAFKGSYTLLQDKRIREINYGDLNGEPADFKKDMSQYFTAPFPKGESYLDVQRRVAEFLNYLYDNYYGKRVALVSHHAPQLAIEVLLNHKTWEQAVKDDWRSKKEWRPGWDYMMEQKVPVPKVIAQQPEPESVEELKESESEKIKPAPGDQNADNQDTLRPSREAVHKELLDDDVADATQKKKGFLSRVKERVVRFKLTEEKFEEVFWDFELALMENNVAVEVIQKIKKDMHDQLTKENVSRRSVEQVILDTLKASIEDVLNVESFDLLERIKTRQGENQNPDSAKKPFVIAMIGVNGSGKTTALAKLVKLFQKNNLSVVVAAADTFRAAAIQQLEEHTTKLGVKLIKHDYNADPAAVAFDAVKHATAQGLDVVLIDTAGRLQSNSNLMDELKKLIRVNKPDLNIFVGESITGNDCVQQAVAFNEAVGIDGMILSKADIDEKGGAALSVSYVTKKPILFIGTGQTYDDLKPFSKEEVLANLGL